MNVYNKAMKNVKDIPETMVLVQTEDDVLYFNEVLGHEYDYYFCDIRDGDIESAYGCYSLDLDSAVYKIK